MLALASAPGFAVRGLRRSMTAFDSKAARRLGIVSTLIDAVLAFARGRPRSGALLLGAAALSGRVPGLGVIVSVALRLYRRLRPA